jgi:hypothetical protein
MLSFNAMKVQNFPDIDLPTVSVTASLPGAAPGQLETDVAPQDRERGRHAAGPQAHLHQGAGRRGHHHRRVPAGKAGAGGGGRRALGGGSACAPICPADLRDPIVNKLDLAGSRCWPSPCAVPRPASARMDDEALSWFVDNDRRASLLAVRGVGAVNRVGGVTREVRVALDPQKLQALGATAADISRQLRQVQQESAGGRTDLGGGEQPVRTMATVQHGPATGGAGDRAVRRPHASGSPRWPP